MAALPKIHALTLVNDGEKKLCDGRLFMPEYRGILQKGQQINCPKCLAIITNNH